MSDTWIRRLDAPGRLVLRLPAGQDGWGVFAAGDRRRRPLARLDDAALRAALSDGAIVPVEGAAGRADGTAEREAYALTDAGRARARREGAPPEFAFLAQHGGFSARRFPDPDRSGDGEIVRLARDAAGPLAPWMRPRGARPPLLGPVHAAAAALFVRDYERSALVSRVTQDWSGAPRTGARSAPKDRADAPGSRLDAQSRTLDALAEMGPGLDRLLFNVLIRQTGLRLAEAELGWPRRSGSAMLKTALDRLAAHYRLSPAAGAARNSAPAIPRPAASRPPERRRSA